MMMAGSALCYDAPVPSPAVFDSPAKLARDLFFCGQELRLSVEMYHSHDSGLQVMASQPR
jgi:hypothetical protein